MTLSPSDVEQKTFSTALRGYDLDEVDDFLDQVVATIRELSEQRDEQAASGAPPAPVPGEPPITETRDETGPDESAVGRALVAAQETADRIVAKAREEAGRIVAEAREEADTFISARNRRKAEAQAEMDELSELVSGVRSQLAMLATAVADRLDEMDAAIDSVPDGSEADEGAAAEFVSGEGDSESDEDLEEFSLGDAANDIEGEDGPEDAEDSETEDGGSDDEGETSGTTW